jgi:hypothetical protein
MQTTLKIDDDVFQAARQLADRQGQPVDQVISDMARRGMGMSAYITHRNGFPVLVRPGGETVTLEKVNALRDAEYDISLDEAGKS